MNWFYSTKQGRTLCMICAVLALPQHSHARHYLPELLYVLSNRAKIKVKCKSNKVKQEPWFSPTQEKSQVLEPAFTPNEWSLLFHKLLGRHPTPAHISPRVTKMVKILNAKLKNSQYHKLMHPICETLLTKFISHTDERKGEGGARVTLIYLVSDHDSHHQWGVNVWVALWIGPEQCWEGGGRSEAQGHGTEQP